MQNLPVSKTKEVAVPLVSLVMATYNRPNQLVRAVTSCLNQTYKNIELIVIDDYSEKPAKEVLLDIPDPRLAIYRNPTNLGASHSLNRGLRLANGQFLAYMGDDDEIYPNFVEYTINEFLKLPDTFGAVFVNTELRNYLGKTKIHINNTTNLGIKKMLIKCNLLAPCAMYRNNIIKTQEIDTKLKTYAEDYDLLIRIARISKLHSIQYTGYIAYGSSDSRSIASKHKSREKVQDYLRLYKKYMPDAAKFGHFFLTTYRIKWGYLLAKAFLGL